jgi:hypothetical protein
MAGYLGAGDSFNRAITDFAAGYADQNQHDYRALLDAIATGRIETAPATQP